MASSIIYLLRNAKAQDLISCINQCTRTVGAEQGDKTPRSTPSCGLKGYQDGGGLTDDGWQSSPCVASLR